MEFRRNPASHLGIHDSSVTLDTWDLKIVLFHICNNNFSDNWGCLEGVQISRELVNERF